MFCHVSTEHLILNMVIQLFVGLPLEMSHGSKRVAVVYIFGVLAGSLTTSVFDSKVYLAGKYRVSQLWDRLFRGMLQTTILN